jgi:hypothetical protein
VGIAGKNSSSPWIGNTAICAPKALSLRRRNTLFAATMMVGEHVSRAIPMDMLVPGTQALIAAAVLNVLAAMAHLACIAIGPPAYRFMGAGEKMARSVQAGKLQPTLVTLAVAGMLMAGAAYALSGAGVIARLPLTRPALLVICAIYLARAIAVPFLRRRFPGNSAMFWAVSSCICLVIGLVHLYGLVSLWNEL